MKKLATILMLVVCLLAGGATVEAKTTKKGKAKTSHRSSSRTSARPATGLSINTFCDNFLDYGLDIDDWGITRSQAAKTMVTKYEYDIEQSLLYDADFDRVFRITRNEWDDSIDENVECVHAYYTRYNSAGVTIVRETCGQFEIEFPTTAERDKFLKTAEAKGYRYNRDSDSYEIPGTEDIYWIAASIFVNGNKVSIGASGE